MTRWLTALLALALLGGAPQAAGQSRAADSLRTLLDATKRDDTLRVRRLHALSGEVVNTDLPQAISLLEQALALSRRIGDYTGEGRALISLGTMCRRQYNFPLAKRYTEQAKALFTRRADRSGLAKTYLQFSIIAMLQEYPTQALEAALRGVRYAEQAKDKVALAQLQAIMGAVLFQIENYKDALPMFHSAYKNGAALGDKYIMASALNMLGNTYKKLENWQQALVYLRRSLQLNRSIGDTRSATIDEINMAELYAQMGNETEALRYGLHARAMARANKDAYNLPGAELALARGYLLANRLDSSIALARHSFQLGQAAKSNENLRSASDVLAQAYAKQGDFAQAYQYQRLWVAYEDSVSGDDIQKRTSAIRYGYELDKKQNQIALLTKTQQLQAQQESRQRLQLYGLLAGLLGTVLVVALLARNVYLKQRTNRALNKKNNQIAHQRDNLNRTLFELKAAQAQLVQSEKMVALAALTAGVAHEIQNPLNFVNNFSEVSMELVTELEEEEQKSVRDPALESLLLTDLKQNLRKIHQHGTRAGDIVKGMLEHAHTDTGERQPADFNALVRDYLRLAHHSLLAKHRHLTVAHTCDLDPNLGSLPLVPQEMGRVLLNLFTNAFYAVQQKAAAHPDYSPQVFVTTRRLGRTAELRVRDNGTGIPAAALEKIFDPFFTTKPPGDGTGLGLWLCYDIITKGYGGTVAVQSTENEYTEFVITLPLATDADHSPSEALADADPAMYVG